MLSMLLVSIPVRMSPIHVRFFDPKLTDSPFALFVQYQIGFLMSTGHDLKDWACKHPYQAYDANSPRAGAQAGFLIFWSYVS